jgi:predicted outer membrane repeat protein
MKSQTFLFAKRFLTAAATFTAATLLPAAPVVLQNNETLTIASAGDLGVPLSQFVLFGDIAPVLAGTDTAPILKIAAGADVTFDGNGSGLNRLEIAVGKTGAIQLEPDATLTFTRNVNTYSSYLDSRLASGGAISVGLSYGASIYLSDHALFRLSGGNMHFTDNEVLDYGGAIALSNDYGPVTISLTTGDGEIFFARNKADVGGAISADANNNRSGCDTSVTLTSGRGITFSGNVATDTGGAISSYSEFGNSRATLTGTGTGGITFRENTAIEYGGAIDVQAPEGDTVLELIADSGEIRFEKNTTPNGYGAAIATYTGNNTTVSITSGTAGTTFTGNLAHGDGGAILALSDTGSVSIVLDARKGDILFEGNRHGVTFSADGTPHDGTGTPNAIYIANRAAGTADSLVLAAGAGRTITFKDPIQSQNPIANIAINKIGGEVTTGTVRFEGATSSVLPGDMTVHGGTLLLHDHF